MYIQSIFHNVTHDLSLAVSSLINKSLPWDYDFKFVVEEISNVNDKAQVSYSKLFYKKSSDSKLDNIN